MSVRFHNQDRLNSARCYYRLIVMAAGSLLLLTGSLQTPPSAGQLWAVLIVTLFVAFQFVFPIQLSLNEIYVFHVIILGGGLLYGPVAAGWSATLGIFLGYLIRKYGSNRPLVRSIPAPPDWSETGFTVGLYNTSLFLALHVSGWDASITSNRGLAWSGALAPILFFTVLHGGLLVGDFLFRWRSRYDILWRDLIGLGLVELIPLPFILTAVLGYAQVGIGSIVALIGGIPAILAVLVFRLHSVRAELEHRVGELTTLNEVSRVLRTTLDLDNLLSMLYLQVSQLLSVENFYVALLSQDEEQIWYPLAFKRGQRQQWTLRPFVNRLTDRVIRERQPILLARHAQEELARIGMPSSEDSPTAWMGVPLISSRRVIGCLAVFSLTPDAEFNQGGLDVLVTLSGQVSVAIENALLHEDAQRRATQLETVSRITTLSADSLNPQEILPLACRLVTETGDAEHSAIFMADLDEGRVWLAQAHNLSDDFVKKNQTFSLAHSERVRSLRTGQAVLTPDLSSAILDNGFKEALDGEAIQAFGDFPLITPEGQIGYLSVYFNTRHNFSAEEVEFLQTIAAQVALAVSSFRLHTRSDRALSRRAHQLSILEAVGLELSAAVHSDLLFEMILDYALEFTSARWGCINLYSPADEIITIKAARGYPKDVSEYPVDQGISGRAVRSQQVINVSDVSKDPDFVDHSNGKVRSHLSIPLTREARVLGVLVLESDKLNAFSANDRSFISQLASQAAVAVVNAELFSEASQGRDRLAALLNSVEEGILLVEAGGRITLVNDSIGTITGLPLNALKGKRLTDLPAPVLSIFGYSLREAEELIGTLGQGQVPASPKATIKIPENAAERVLDRSLSPVWGRRGKVIGWMIVLRDVTEEFNLAQTRELITETLVHDLRSPISAVMGALDAMDEAFRRDKSGESDLPRQAVPVARRGAQRVLDLIESLLELDRMQSGKIEIAPAAVDLHALAADVLDEFISQSHEFGVVLRNEISPDIPFVRADLSKIARVLTNLVDNAIKFTPTGGQITVSAALYSDARIVIRVNDTGPGIPGEFREKIFDRFGQVPGLRGRRRGTGLGLTFCRLAVEAHGGRIWVEPVHQGGSSFAFTLPISNPS